MCRARLHNHPEPIQLKTLFLNGLLRTFIRPARLAVSTSKCSASRACALLNVPSVIFDENFHQPTIVYIGVGKEGLTPGARTHVMEVDANLLAERIQGSKSKSISVYLDYLPEEDHATIGHQAVFNAFRLLYPQKEK